MIHSAKGDLYKCEVGRLDGEKNETHALQVSKCYFPENSHQKLPKIPLVLFVETV
jgi:hypothetical protein